MKIKKILLLSIAGMLLFITACGQAEIRKEQSMAQTQPMKTQEQSPSYNGTYKVVAQALDWGAAAIKAVVKLDAAITASDMCRFRVTESNKSGAVGERDITGVYLCDKNGNKIDGSSRYLAIEMSVDPSHGGLLYYDRRRLMNVWDEDYRLNIEPVDPENDMLKNLTVDPKYTEKLMPQADVFSKTEFSYQGTTMKYALYAPDPDGKKKPLVVWLHGQGEGGDDVTITLLGSKVTALAADDIQGILGGAYVLVPQCPTYWTVNAGDTSHFGMRPDGTSDFEEPLLALINGVVGGNEDIDADRIYIGGCSMGGYMTVLMAKNHPDLFAAAFPVCEFYEDRLLTDDDIKALTDVPLWFAYCTADESVPPRYHSEATIERLREAGAGNLHASVFEDVHDTTGEYTNKDGTPYIYNAHFVWIYVYNNECVEGDLNLWEWLALQHK